MAAKRIAIIGAGPVGLEAALYATTLGHSVTVFERGEIGRHVREWGHVRLFSPLGFNVSVLGRSALADDGVDLPDDACFQLGRDYIASYLEPLARGPLLCDSIREYTEVLAVGRDRLLKSDLIGGDRGSHPFRLLVRRAEVESVEFADVVLDCSGTWRHANALGSGGIPAPGETSAAHAIRYRLDDILGVDRPRYEGRRVMLVGAGHSAATALDQLRTLNGTAVVWVRRGSSSSPYPVHADDPLPERDRLNRLGNRIASGGLPGIEVRDQTVVERVETTTAETLRVHLNRGDDTDVVEVDTILALVGFRPDRDLYRELQIHECWATMGPMKLAASLLTSAGGDCLAQSSAGAETLTSPEPSFFILGSKSYGTNVNFLIQLGLEQIRDVFTLIDEDPGLDLYALTGSGRRTTDAR